MIGTLNKPSVWFGLTIVSLLLIFLVYHKIYVAPIGLGKIWLVQVENDGFIVKFQLVGPKGDTIPAKGTLGIRFNQQLYPGSEETGANWEGHYEIRVSDFEKENIGSAEEPRYIYTANLPKITYGSFAPPMQRGVICKIYLTFISYMDFNSPKNFQLVKEVYI